MVSIAGTCFHFSIRPESTSPGVPLSRWATHNISSVSRPLPQAHSNTPLVICWGKNLLAGNTTSARFCKGKNVSTGINIIIPRVSLLTPAPVERATTGGARSCPKYFRPSASRGKTNITRPISAVNVANSFQYQICALLAMYCSVLTEFWSKMLSNHSIASPTASVDR